MKNARCRSGDAWNGTEVFINRSHVVARKVLKDRPRHDLQKVTVERQTRGKAIGGYTGGAIRVQVIQVDTRPENLFKLRQRTPTYRTPSTVGRQVPRNNLRRARTQQQDLLSDSRCSSRLH